MAYLTEDQLEEFKDAFSLFDKAQHKDDEPTMSVKDVNLIMRSLGYNLTEVELADMVKEVDTEGTGMMGFDEFVTMATKKIKTMDNVKEIRHALQEFDPEGTGLVPSENLRKVLIDMGERFTDEEVDEMIREADLDADGMVHVGDFLNLMTGYNK